MPAKGKGRAKPAAGHKLASELPRGSEMKDLRKKSWFLGEPVGSGGFGLIYLADNKKDHIGKDKAEFVIKVEPHENGPLFCELAFYQRVAKPESLAAWKKSSRLSYVGIPPYVAHGLHVNGEENLRFMVMPRFGCDLHSLWLKANKKFSRATVCQIAIQLIKSLEYMHASEYVHADVKGGNILLGHKDPNQIFLVDFGLAYRYVVDGKHKEYHEDPRKAHDGTIEYTSRDAHLGVSPSRRSDLEILGYVLLHWLSGKLPWEDNLNDKNYVKEQKIKHMKKVKQFVTSVYPDSKTHQANEIEKFLQDVSKLGYNEQPNYDSLGKYFQDALKSMGVPLKSKISFDIPEASTQIKKTKRSAQPKKKPRTLANSSESLQSDEEKEVVPKKRARKPAARRKQVLSPSEEEELSSVKSISDEEPTSEETPIKTSRARKKPVSSVKKTAPKRERKPKRLPPPETSSDEAESEKATSSKKPVRTKKPKALIKNSPLSSAISITEDEVNVIDSTSSSSSPVRRRDTRSSFAEQESSLKKNSPKKNTLSAPKIPNPRYSMAPLHTQSVLAEGDTLSGKYLGKHPVIIRRRKVKRPKTDAVTQTTPSLSKRSSRI